MNEIDENKIVALLSSALALECGIHKTVAGRLRSAAAMHDIGKTGIPKKILNKQGALTAPEFTVMKTHTTIGAEMLASIQGELGDMARTICLYHHEWYDGLGGYWNKHTCELPLYVPIVAVADVFIALLCRRPYKPAWLVDEAIGYIRDKAGTQFNPALVDIFIKYIKSENHAEDILKGIRVCGG